MSEREWQMASKQTERAALAFLKRMGVTFYSTAPSHRHALYLFHQESKAPRLTDERNLRGDDLIRRMVEMMSKGYVNFSDWVKAVEKYLEVK